MVRKIEPSTAPQGSIDAVPSSIVATSTTQRPAPEGSASGAIRAMPISIGTTAIASSTGTDISLARRWPVMPCGIALARSRVPDSRSSWISLAMVSMAPETTVSARKPANR